MREYNGFILKNPHDGNYQICIRMKREKYWVIDAAFPKDSDVVYYSDSGMQELPGHIGYLVGFKIDRSRVIRMLKARRDANSERLIPAEKPIKSMVAVESLESAVGGYQHAMHDNSRPSSLQQNRFNFDNACDDAIGLILRLI